VNTMQKQRTAHGVPRWVTLASLDVPAAASFYRALLGWQTIGDENRLLASRDGVPVGALLPGAGETPGWLLHLGVPSVTQAIDDVVRAGGSSVTGPEADGTGAMVAIVTDPAGVRFALRESAAALPLDQKITPGTLAWGELITDDVDASAAFYAKAFGWELTDAVGSLSRREWQVHGGRIAGLLPRPPAMPNEIPPYWDVYFAVDDIAAASQTAADHGGTRLMPPTPIEIGTIAVFLDPAGAIFTLVQLGAEEAAA